MEWNGAIVRTWLDRRVIAARSDQVAAERSGRGQNNECDKAAAEEMVCSMMKNCESTDVQTAFVADLRRMLDQHTYIWSGVYDDVLFDRHVRSYIRKLIKMVKANVGFEMTLRYQ